jgi:phage tail protein X
MSSIVVSAHSGEPVDSLVWRSIGAGGGVVEAVLEANPGLTELGAALPEGTIVTVPLPATPAPEAPLVQLWS